jgi:23S rRNA (adenine2503-C2)-methyltransferase
MTAVSLGRPAAPTTLYEVDLPTLTDTLTTWGEPRYRVAQVWDALYRQHRPLAESTAVPAALRQRLADEFPLALVSKLEQHAADGMTGKWLWGAGTDGREFETVLMRYPDRATVCVSSQAGCAMGCTFCATGQEGFERHLTTGEIVEQVVRASQHSEQRVGNVVFMGMGEPLANYDPVWGAVERLHRDIGLSARHITISTVGIVPGIRRLARETLPVTLAVSLHAPDDDLRNTMIPINRRYPIAEVLDAAAEFSAARGRRVTFEYASIEGINDSPEQAEKLAKLLRAFRGKGGAHVNIIPLNPTEGFAGMQPPPGRMLRFAEILEAAGFATSVRRNRGVDIDAACGQLRSRSGHDGADPEIAE